MIAQTQADIILLNDEDEQSSIDMSLDSDSAHIIMQMLSKNLYSDSIGSTVREVTSNGLDSHRRAGVTDVPIIVSLKKNNDDNYEFIVQDFGTGLDDNEVKDIISKYGKSTKRKTANELGMYGLGFKSPLAYSNSFYFVCRKNGKERKYMMYEDVDGNKIDLLDERDTTERNGLSVIIPVKESDKYAFYHKIKEQLCYFENVYFDVPCSSSYPEINNNFTIHRSEHFQYSELATDTHMHICLDNVHYNIDWNNLGIKPIQVPIGLRFTLSDGLFPLPNRETLRYTKDSIALILEKIKIISEDFVAKYNESITDTDDIKKAFDFYLNAEKLYDTGIESLEININPLMNYSNIPLKQPKVNGIKYLDIKPFARNRDMLFLDHEIKYQLSYGRISETKTYWYNKVQASVINKQNFLFNDLFTGNKKAYIKEKLGLYSKAYFIKRTTPFVLLPNNDSSNPYKKTNNYYELLSLHKIPKKHWRETIKEFLFIQNEYLKELRNLDDMVIPQEWLDARKNKDSNGVPITRSKKGKNEVSAKVGVPLLREVNSKNCKFEPQNLDLSTIHKSPYLYIYGTNNDVDVLDKLFKLHLQKIKVVVFSDRELKKVEKETIHNLMPLSKFMLGDNKIFKRAVTGFVINKLLHSYPFVFNYFSYIGNVSTDLQSELINMVSYRNLNFNSASDEVITNMLVNAENNNLFDQNIYPEYLYLKEKLEYLYFLNPIMKTWNTYVHYNNDEEHKNMIKIVSDLFKYHKQKVNIENYKTVSIKENEITK